MVILLLMAAAAGAVSDAASGCSVRPVVEACRDLHGRLQASNGGPSLRIWVVGTKQVLGVAGDEGAEWLPGSLRQLVSFERSVYGDFRVCPMTAGKAKEMQLVCVESGRKLVAEEFVAGKRRVRRIADVAR
jgi:hypothetical protein